LLLLYAAAFLAAGPVTSWPQFHLSATHRPMLFRADDFWQATVGLASLLIWCAAAQFLMAPPEWLLQAAGPIDRPLITATVLHGLITALLAAAIAGRTTTTGRIEFAAQRNLPRLRRLVEPLAIAAAISLVVSAPLLFTSRTALLHSAQLAHWAAIGWLFLAAARRWRLAVQAVQVMSWLAAALAILELWRREEAGERWQ